MSNHSKAQAGARYLLGGVFLLFGANGFLGFIPQPDPPAQAGAFLAGLAASGYLFPLLKGTEIVAGVLLLSKRFVPLALALLAPIVLNIALYHLLLDARGLGLAALVLALELYLAWSYRAAYRPMLAAKVEPSGAERASSVVARAAAH